MSCLYQESRFTHFHTRCPVTPPIQVINVGIRNRDFMREPPPREWLEAQEQRIAEAQQRRVARVQSELRLIEELRTKGERAQQEHMQVRTVGWTGGRVLGGTQGCRDDGSS